MGGQLLRQGVDKRGFLFLGKAVFHQVHAGEYVGEGAACHAAALPHDVHDAAVGASGKEYRFLLFLDDEALLMAEVVVHVLPGAKQQSVSYWHEALAVYAGKQYHVFAYLGLVPAKHHPLVGSQVVVDADISQSALTQGVMRLESVAVDIDLGFIVQFQEGAQPAAMVVMAVRNDGRVHVRQPDAQPLGVVCEEPALPHVKEDLPPVVQLDVQAQPVLHGQSSPAGVLHE